jgi:AraC-like DNA-binding protein
LESTIAFTCLLGLILPLVILYYNKGYLSANRYLAAFLFFASLYVLENFYFFYGESLPLIAAFTCLHFFFYLIGPFAFFYVRSILRDNSKLSKSDYLHFALFVFSFIGYIPYFFSSWDFKLEVAQNLNSENWDISNFYLNKVFYHKVDQVLIVFHTYFYSIALWYLFWYYKKKNNNPIHVSRQYKLIRNWLLVFISIFSIITISVTATMASIWIYDEKSIFLDSARVALFFDSIVYIGMSTVIFFFPHIMYGLPIGLKLDTKDLQKAKEQKTSFTTNEEHDFLSQEDQITLEKKNDLQLFTHEYIQTIGASLASFVESKVFLNTDFMLITISNESRIPAHHLSYFFNNIKKISFSDWRNNLRIEEAKILIRQGETDNFTMQSIALRCGFTTQSTFIRAFKNVTGITPSAYLKSVS